MKFCVYRHTSPSGKVYIGITRINPVKRWENGHGYKNNPHFWNAIVKYGWDNFTHEILFSDLEEDEAKKIEKELITYHHSNKFDYGYNRSGGGEPFFQCKHTESAKQKMSNSHKGKYTGENNPMFGKHNCGSANGMYGKHHSEEWRKKRSEQYSGKSHPRFGVILTDEEKHKIMCGQPNKKTVLQCSNDGILIKEYNSVREVARLLNVNHTTVLRWCTGKIKPSNGYVWKFSEKGGA